MAHSGVTVNINGTIDQINITESSIISDLDVEIFRAMIALQISAPQFDWMNRVMISPTTMTCPFGSYAIQVK